MVWYLDENVYVTATIGLRRASASTMQNKENWINYKTVLRNH